MQGAAVDQVAVQVHHQILAPHQRAGAVDVARLYAHIHLRHHHRLPAAVGKLNAGVDQPDHVLRQQAHLFGGERHARDKLMRLPESNARIHQCPELGLIVAVVAQVAAAGERDDLLAYQALLVIAVAKALVHVIRIRHERILHIITAEPRLVVGEAWIGFDQVVRIRIGQGVKQAAVRQTDVRPCGTYHHALRIAGGRFNPFARRIAGGQGRGTRGGGVHTHRQAPRPAKRGICFVGAGGGKGHAAAIGLAVAFHFARRQGDRLDNHRRGVVRGAFSLRVATLSGFTAVVCDRACIGDPSAAFRHHVIHRIGEDPERSPRHNLAFIVQNLICRNQHIAAGEDFARVTFGNHLFFNGAGVGVLVKVVVVGPGIVRGVEVKQVVGRVVVDEHAVSIRIPAGGRSLLLILVDLLRGDERHFGAEMVVDVVELADGERHVARGLNGRAVVVEGLRLPDGEAVVVHAPADGHRPVAVDQRVVAVVDCLCPDVHALASGEGRCRSVLGEVIERCRLNRQMIAVDAAGTRVR